MKVLIVSLPVLLLVVMVTVEAAPPGGRKLLWWGGLSRAWANVKDRFKKKVNNVHKKVETHLSMAAFGLGVEMFKAHHKMKKHWDGFTDFVEDKWDDHVLDRYNNAKREFEKITHARNFDEVVEALIPHIHSEMTVEGCTGVCVGLSANAVGPFAILASPACSKACDGALAELEELAKG